MREIHDASDNVIHLAEHRKAKETQISGETLEDPAISFALDALADTKPMFPGGPTFASYWETRCYFNRTSQT